MHYTLYIIITVQRTASISTVPFTNILPYVKTKHGEMTVMIA